MQQIVCIAVVRLAYLLPKLCTAQEKIPLEILGQYRTKSVWRLCTPSACKFPVIFHKNAREYIKYSLRFLFHLTKNLTTHLSHNLCAVLPWKTLHQARLTVLFCVFLVRTMLTAIFYKYCLFYFCFCVIFMMQPYGIFRDSLYNRIRWVLHQNSIVDKFRHWVTFR